ncbi:hypothetical protein OJF2_72470 [Aquisphaera giovannonii]|uniref:Phage P2 GpU n=1 Tax=Aquisphaera giovannonii TaxID=406548 RepID=A0A5B9WFA5_9BACT|nr:hypothetical protein [Aquisphaera giovannonii]QEH38641.1 hypothetical protein OJF2_72470 [Aquisphaera giovannonii]
MVTYDGNNIFGAAVQLQHVTHPSAQQLNAFFGVSGSQALYGGGRGRMFLIRGILLGRTVADLNAAEASIRGFADGQARVLVDPQGRAWPNVIFRGEYIPDGRGPLATAGGWAQPYRAVFHGLT